MTELSPKMEVEQMLEMQRRLLGVEGGVAGDVVGDDGEEVVGEEVRGWW